MDEEIKNKEEAMIIKNKKEIPAEAILSDELRNKIPAGSYLMKDGKLIPNDNDEAMKARKKKK